MKIGAYYKLEYPTTFGFKQRTVIVRLYCHVRKKSHGRWYVWCFQKNCVDFRFREYELIGSENYVQITKKEYMEALRGYFKMIKRLSQ